MRWLDKKGEDLKDYKDLNDYEIMYMIEEDNEDAKELMIKKYEPLITKYAKKYYQKNKNCGLELEDYIQEGYCAVYFAYKKYDSSKDNLFYTYVDLCIRCKIRSLYLKHNRLKNKALNESISLYGTLNNDDDTIYLDVLMDKNALLPESELEKKEEQERLKNAIYELSLKEACVLEMYYNGFTLKDISRLLDMKYRSTIQIMSRIKKKLLND